MKHHGRAFLRIVLGAVAVGVLLSCRAAIADDGAMAGAGGSLQLMSGGHPTISMMSEVVRIDRLPVGRVHARFVFRNHGPACDVTIGFPDESWGDGGAGGYFDDFRSWVDGKEVKIAHVDDKTPHTSTTDTDTKNWFVKVVHFGRNETRVVDDEYTGGGGGMSPGDQMYEYELDTGSSWDGPIRNGEIIVDETGLHKYGNPDISPGTWTRKGTTVVWRFSDLRPGQTDNVTLIWKPRYTNVTVNGRTVPDYLKTNDSDSDDDIIWYSQRRGNEVWLPAKLAAAWLGADLKMIGRGRYLITRANRSVEFRTWSDELIPSVGGKVVMPFRATIDSAPIDPNAQEFRGKPYHMICLICLVRALGGEAHFDRSGTDLVVTLKDVGH